MRKTVVGFVGSYRKAENIVLDLENADIIGTAIKGELPQAGFHALGLFTQALEFLFRVVRHAHYLIEIPVSWDRHNFFVDPGTPHFGAGFSLGTDPRSLFAFFRRSHGRQG